MKNEKLFYDCNYSYPGEEWKPIKRYEGLYEISNYGRVKSLRRYRANRKNNKGGYFMRESIKKLTLGKGKNAYYTVHLCKNNKEEKFYVHRLVAKHFLNGKEKETVNHKDGNKINNYYKNLEWATYLENNLHAFQNGLMRSPKKGLRNLTNSQIKKVKTLLKNGYSQRKIAKMMGVSRTPIQKIAEKRYFGSFIDN